MKREIKERIEKINKGIVPEGYKETKIGIIPEDWEVNKVNKIANCYSGGTPATNHKDYYNGEIPFIRSTELNQKHINKTEHKINDRALKESSAKLIKEGTLLLAIYGATSGVVAISEIKASINQAVLAIETKKNTNKMLLFYLFDINKNNIVKKYTQGGQPNLSGKIVKQLRFQLPKHLEEQTQIANILSTWDKAIELKEKQLGKKEEIKKGLMQKLLTGEIRLEGFNGEWEEVKLGKYLIKSTLKNNNHKKVELVLSVTNSEGFVKQEDYFDRSIASKNTENYYIVKKGDFAYNPSRINVGSIAYLENFKEGLLSPMYNIFRTKKSLDNSYLKYYFDTHEFSNKLKQYLEGSVRKTLNFNSMKAIKIKLPQLQEQKAIAQILSTQDRTIELLEKQIEKLKEQKKGLMQLLLTGKIRVNGIEKVS